MKKIIPFLFLLISTTLFSQDGIKFGKQSFAKTLEQAKKENKLIFLDAFASWCGPCKLLDKNVFPKKEVGDYFKFCFFHLFLFMCMTQEEAKGKQKNATFAHFCAKIA
jgi:thiol:disulfide interchange protein